MASPPAKDKTTAMRVLKAAAIVLVGIIIVLLVGTALATYLVNYEPYQQLLTDRVSQSLGGRAVSFDRLRVSFLPDPRITFTDVRVDAGPGSPFDNLFIADRLRVRLDSIPLLKGEIRIDALRLRKPHLWLYRSPQGNLNLADVLSGRGRKKGHMTPIERFFVQDGEITYQDQALQPPLTLDMVDVDLSITDYQPGEVATFRMTGNIGPHEKGGKVTAEGRYGPITSGSVSADTELVLDATLHNVSPEEFAALLPAPLGIVPSITIKLKAHGTMGNLKPKVDVEVLGLRYHSPRREYFHAAAP